MTTSKGLILLSKYLERYFDYPTNSLQSGHMAMSLVGFIKSHPELMKLINSKEDL